METAHQAGIDENAIAIIGLSGRFPGANDIEAFWRNIRTGTESITSFSSEELAAAGSDWRLLQNPHYVKARATVDDIEWFDAEFFEYSPREAELMDPQQRFFLECAWQALEHAGYDSSRYDGAIGVYAGQSVSTYLLSNLLTQRNLLATHGFFPLLIGNGNDHLTTRVSYKLNLHGPSITVQTACSTSLVAVHMACQSILSGECDIALAGGVSLAVPQKSGYLYVEGGVVSPDGHCRAFDADAQGTVNGSGVGVVVLKRLADALAHGDTVHAVIKGSAVNNDGGMKVGYTAPGVHGQMEVISEALAVAGVDPETIGYIEAHGTGTPLGDPIEIAALSQVFGIGTTKKQFCALGSVKTNIGHIDAGAGVASLIKVVQALKHRELPPSLHFQRPNPQIDFIESPFYVNTKLQFWATEAMPRRAGVSSFGIGGTNAHVILEEAPIYAPHNTAQPWQILILSARSESALARANHQLIEHLKQHPELDLADIAYTLQVGRRTFRYRQMLICHDREDALQALETTYAERVLTSSQVHDDRSITFLFPGQGTQYVQMARGLYEHAPVFSKQIDLCAQYLLPHLKLDLRDVLYPTEQTHEEADLQLQQTWLTQPALFTIEYAYAQLLMSWGVQPQAMIGHSIGEYVAACLAGVFSLEDALALVAARGRLMQQVPTGAMLAVSLSEQEVMPLLGETLSLAAVNAPDQCVVAGPVDAIEVFTRRIEARETHYRHLRTSHAFHSSMMDPILDAFAEQVQRVHLHAPHIPYLSNLTGTWVNAREVTRPEYWVQHLRHTVRFANALQKVGEIEHGILLEVGPGRSLSSLASSCIPHVKNYTILTTLSSKQDATDDYRHLLAIAGRLWLSNIALDWSQFVNGEKRQRVPLPTYPFERQRYWIDPLRENTKQQSISVIHKRKEVADWFYLPSWHQMPLAALPRESDAIRSEESWLLFSHPGEMSRRITIQLEQYGHRVVNVIPGKKFARIGERQYMIDPCSKDNYLSLVQELQNLESFPTQIGHLWLAAANDSITDRDEQLQQGREQGFYSLLFLVQALAAKGKTAPLRVSVLSHNMHAITGKDNLDPARSLMLGLCTVIPQEYPHITCRCIDYTPAHTVWQQERIDRHLCKELVSTSHEHIVAYTGFQRWVQTYIPNYITSGADTPKLLRKSGVYLIIGGLGDVGLHLATSLARFVQPVLILTGRSPFPPRDTWDQWLAAHPAHDPTSNKIHRLLVIEQLGAQLFLCQADVGNEEQMRNVIEKILEDHTTLDGVIHAASIDKQRTFLSIDEAQRLDCEQILYPKVQGLLVLERVLRGRKLDFCLLCSSLSSVLGGLGFATYAAANAYLDAFALHQSQVSPTPWISINWDGWRHDEHQQVDHGPGASAIELAMTPQEGTYAFSRILTLDEPLPRIIVSTGDLQQRLQHWVVPSRTLSEERASESMQAQDALLLHPRPALQIAYVGARNAIEKTIIEIWQELLGIEPIGIYDDFFELGGHSLLATRVLTRLRTIFQVDLSLRAVFEAHTIAQIAATLEEAFVEKLAALSEQEAQQFVERFLKE